MRIAVVIPAYKMSRQIIGVLERIGLEVRGTYVVD